jgi:hypothetical protein
MDHAEIRLSNGDAFVVEGALEEVERKLSDAARSGASRLAWFDAEEIEGRVGINPSHVVTLKSAD